MKETTLIFCLLFFLFSAFFGFVAFLNTFRLEFALTGLVGALGVVVTLALESRLNEARSNDPWNSD